MNAAVESGQEVLIVFAKAPRPGSVKTRLARTIGDRAAAELYRVLAEEEFRRTRPERGDYRRAFFFAPVDARSEVEAWVPAETWLPQEGHDLGARMAAAFGAVFSQGARRAAIIGSDCPWLSRERVVEALALLEDRDVVVGPSGDGGYSLLALRREQPGLFEGIAWSSPSVLATTLERASRAGLEVKLLDPLPDIDTLDDVRREWARLRPLIEDAPLLAALKAALSR